MRIPFAHDRPSEGIAAMPAPTSSVAVAPGATAPRCGSNEPSALGDAEAALPLQWLDRIAES